MNDPVLTSISSISSSVSTGFPTHTVYPDDPGYPHLLLPLDDRPVKLFFRGSGVQLNEKCIAVVGTRRMTAYGKSATKSFVRDLVLAGFTIVSGLASGVDGEAHQTALDFDGKTIAIMPSGLDVITPIEHTNLAASIIKADGAIYSEYDLRQQAAKFHFHVRNRIIAGISMGVLVIEAGERSGTAITVGHAGRYGRPVFAVPGPWTNPYSEGTKAMVNMGAKLVTNIQDILEELNLSLSPVNSPHQSSLLFETADEEKIYRMLEDNGASSFNSLLNQTNLSLHNAQVTLTTLELRGLIEQKFGEYMIA